jgi:uncharacterized protein (TIGR03067 family)
MFIRASVSIALALATLRLATGRADAPKDIDEFKVVVASELEGAWGTNRMTNDTGSYSVMKRPGEYAFVYKFSSDWFFSGRANSSGRYTVKKGGQLDITYDRGDWAGKTAKCIYKLEGDTLMFCWAPPGMERPTEFKCPPGSNRMFVVLNRMKP